MGISGGSVATLAGRCKTRPVLSLEEQVRAAQTSLQASLAPKVSDVAAAAHEPARGKEVEREEA
jgi:hypothetical protein